MGMILFRLITAALLPVLLAVCFRTAERKGRLSKASYPVQQTIIGVSFGIVAILATEFGIPVNGAVVNVRNAAPLTAGLVFGWPAGLISGVIGGVHRWFSDAGDFTRMACTIATFVAGVIGANVRIFMTDHRKASWFYGLAVGFTVEVLHMLLVFATNTSALVHAFEVVRVAAIPMILSNGLSVMSAILVLTVIDRPSGRCEGTAKTLAETFQLRLILCVVVAFAITSLLTRSLLTGLAFTTVDQTLQVSVQDIRQDIRDASDRNLMEITRRIARVLPENPTNADLRRLAGEHLVSEINLVGTDGVITCSTDPEIIGFDMHMGAQAAEFLCLLEGTDSLVQDYQNISREVNVYRKYAGFALEKGFLQVGYDAEAFHQQIHDQVLFATKNHHIGKNGCVIICDTNGVIISDANGHQGDNISAFGMAGSEIRDMERFSAVIYGKDAYCMYTAAEGYYIIGVMFQDEALFVKNASVYMLAFMEVLVFAALFSLIFFLIRGLVVKNVRRVNASLSRITAGDLSETVNVREYEEFASLSDGINQTVSTLKQYIAEAAARFDKELEIARQIQYSALPSVFPPYPNRTEFDIFASMDPAKEVGGDFYEFFLVSEKQLAFAVADVSGKGIPGAMFMMTAKSILKGLLESGLSVGEAFTRANAQLCESNEAGMFVTAWMGILNLENGLVSFANAGHNPPVVKRGNGEYAFMKSKVSFVLAGMEGVCYKEQQLQLYPGDEIYLYTDGVTEAHNPEKQLFGEARLLASLNEKTGLSVDMLCKKVKRDVGAFVGEAEQFDDITMLCIRLNNIGAARQASPEADEGWGQTEK